MGPPPLYKYPRTPHLVGSAVQAGDDPAPASYDSLLELFSGARRTGGPVLTSASEAVLVVEEKLDGSNCGISFSPDGRLWIQSRGHYLVGGPREKHFSLLKSWAATHHSSLWAALGTRYILYGEWLEAKHTIYYDALPHYFLEFDVFDTHHSTFLGTQVRRELLSGLPVVSVPVLSYGRPPSAADLRAMLRPSLYKTAEWNTHLREAAIRHGQDPDRVASETDPSILAEGLYLKVEQDGVVRSRHKLVRSGFLNHIIGNDGAPSEHWLDRPHVPNRLAASTTKTEAAA